jgi:hypothetical protein
VAKGRRTSLVVHATALLLALALAALAAWLWLGDAPRETSVPEGAEDAGAPPLHPEHSQEDEDALRDLLRREQGDAQ